MIGAGLPGLVAAPALSTSGASAHVLKARGRGGGGTLTWRPGAESGAGEAAADAGDFNLGATWCWPHQTSAFAGEWIGISAAGSARALATS